MVSMVLSDMDNEDVKYLPFDVTATASTQIGSTSIYKGNATLPSFTGTFLGVVLTSVMDTTYYSGNAWAVPYSSSILVCVSPISGVGIRAQGYIMYR